MDKKINLQSGLNKYVKLNGKVKAWLIGEIQDTLVLKLKINRKSHRDDVDSTELGILDGRYECADNLLEQIKEWENEA
jgi:hypothetical protein